ncbi:MAG: carbamoyltransferase HypF [Capsulimonadaceae bacterium]
MAGLSTQIQRMRLAIQGAVQGVGFRPYVYRLATELKLTGRVFNSPAGVIVEVEGLASPLLAFRERLPHELPPAAYIHTIEASILDPVGFETFEIVESDQTGPRVAVILPDLATCSDCLSELTDPNNRRYRYPFINCTNCGPRYSIIESVPYDRPATTMRGFEMCPACRAEYNDPANRRFHAQPNACPACGPQLALWASDGTVLAREDAALVGAANAVMAGKIVAVKGIGGFQLLVDARDDDAVRQLRDRKHREEKPFAVMFPNLEAAASAVAVSGLSAQLLRGIQAPIVLIDRTRRDCIAESVAPWNPALGVMLPYTPLHHLLLARLRIPVVCTSGNLSDEPICIDEIDALERLGKIADIFLVHNRPIARNVDDSVVRIILGRELVLRRARGYAPLPIPVRDALPPILAYGAHQKCTAGLSVGSQVILSQHIGDLETAAAAQALERAVADLPGLYETTPDIAACDLHPDYKSTRIAERSGLPIERIQHHYAHVLACMAENEIDGPVLGVAWDGTGLGDDGTIWGGEFLVVNGDGYQRVAHLRPFPLPGGDHAVREPRRSALSLLHAVYGAHAEMYRELPSIAAFDETEMRVILQMLNSNLNCPMTSSIGRLFDGVASLIGLRQRVAYEGQAAVLLEYAAQSIADRFGSGAPGLDCSKEKYGLPLRRLTLPHILDWGPVIGAIVADMQQERPVAEIAACFHNALVEAIVEVARRIRVERVVLTGGCFQSRYLTVRTVERLRECGFRPYWHQRIPPNDGGIALGQVIAAAKRHKRS